MIDMNSCPWGPLTNQLPVHYCESNLCSWVVQPANTWSNISYLIVALVILRQKNLTSDKYWFFIISFCLFIGSTLYHMTGTYWGRDLDVGAMLILSAFILSLTFVRFLNLKRYWVWVIAGISLCLTLPRVGIGNGGLIFVIQCLVAALVEFFHFKKAGATPEQKKWLMKGVGLFLFALVLNILDMKRIYCLPDNNVITLHAIWHLICGYCIYLIAKYYAYDKAPNAISQHGASALIGDE